MQSEHGNSSPPPPSMEQDHLDRLPDALIIVILSKLADVRSLGSCLAVSRRLRSIVPLVHHLHLNIDDSITFDSPPTPRPLFSRLRNLVLSNRPRYSPAHVLKTFTHVRHLTIELPSAQVDTRDGVYLKWRAEYGRNLHRCFILRSLNCVDTSMIEMARRHQLVCPIVRELPTLRSLLFTDADGQGMLSMEGVKLRESRETPEAAAWALPYTALVPSKMELRYVPHLKLANGIGIRGATLMTVNLDGEASCRWVAEAFDEPSGAVVIAFMKQKVFLHNKC